MKAAEGRLLVIAGPTATGKTEAAMIMAQRHGGEIVSADSMQVYRGMDIGTAKPTPEQRAQVRFHLVDCADPRESFTVADFQRQARAAIADIQARGRLAILCGGTGLYIRAVLGGLVFPPGASRETAEVRRRLQREAEALGPEALHQRLAEIDPVAAGRLAPADTKRIIRALEVYETTGRPFSALARVDEQARVLYNANTFVLNCPRPQLYRRIDMRVDQMMAAGWLDEVRHLRAAGLSSAHQSMQALGYRHLLNFLERPGDLEQTVAIIKRDTRRFAKRQLTWFRREQGQWLEWDEAAEFKQAIEVIAANVAE